MANYDGLTRNEWPGTWSPSADHPIVLDTELRGALRYVSGVNGDRVVTITGQRLQEGMLVYIGADHDGFVAGGYYKYVTQPGDERDADTGSLPNDSDHWTPFLDSAEVANKVVNLVAEVSEDLSGVTETVVDAFATTKFRTMKYVVQLEHDSDSKYHSTEILLTHNGTNAYLTEYAIVQTDSSLGEFDARIQSGNVELTLTPSYTNTSIKAKRISIDA